MSELAEKVQKSIERLREFSPKDDSGYYLAFSGGKDSVVCKALMDMAGVKYDATYRVTSVDPPELVRFIRDKHPDVKREVPLDKNGKPITMWNLIPRKKMPPTRIARYCCKELKESGGDGRMTVTGVRWEESRNRKENQGLVTVYGRGAARELSTSSGFKPTMRGGVVLTNDNAQSRRMVESCYKRHKTVVNPIIDWSEDDVWDFIRAHGIPYCELYDCGFSRLGCIGCPMAGRRRRERDFTIWPLYYDAYIAAFGRMLEQMRKREDADPTRPVWRQGATDFRAVTAEDVFNWWMEYGLIPGQISLFEEGI